MQITICPVTKESGNLLMNKKEADLLNRVITYAIETLDLPRDDSMLLTHFHANVANINSELRPESERSAEDDRYRSIVNDFEWDPSNVGVRWTSEESMYEDEDYDEDDF